MNVPSNANQNSDRWMQIEKKNFKYGSDEPITTTTLGENDLVGSLARFRLDSNRGTLDWQDEGGCVYPFDAVIHSYISLHS